MISFSAEILKFGSKGEKTGWTYINVPAKIAEKLLPGNKKSFRVKGTLDNTTIAAIALIPMGNGDFIMALNASLRKKIRKQKGDRVKVNIEIDQKPLILSSREFSECLDEEKEAAAFFKTLPLSHRNYFVNWIESAKTDVTKAKRIACAIDALSRKWHFNVMLQNRKAKANDLFGNEFI